MKKIIIYLVILIAVLIGVIIIVKNHQGGTTFKPADIIEVSYTNGSGTLDASFDIEKDTVTFNYGTLGTTTLPLAISASGARYANKDESIVFWEHQGGVTITKNGQTVFEGTLKRNENIPSD